MIRVNLMPAEERAHKTRRAGKSRKPTAGLVLPIAILAGVIVLVVGLVVQQQAQIHLLVQEIAKVEKESRDLAPQIAMVERLAVERADLDLRLSVIDQLGRNRFEAVRLVDELDRAVPEHMWLTSMLQTGEGQMSLEGVTFSNLVVADLLVRLDRSPLFGDVALGIASRGVIEERDVVQFKLTMNVTPGEIAPGDR